VVGAKNGGWVGVGSGPFADAWNRFHVGCAEKRMTVMRNSAHPANPTPTYPAAVCAGATGG
jgi:hypothetical protein